MWGKMDTSLILEKYLRIALGSFSPCVMKLNHFNFRCNVCGDSKKSKRKTRGHLLRSFDKESGEYYWAYKCFNEGSCPCAGDGNAWSGDNWLKHTNISLHKSYLREMFSAQGDKKTKNELEELREIQKRKHEKEKAKQEKENAVREKKNTKFFIPLTLGGRYSKQPEHPHIDIINLAITECKKRRIDPAIWQKWFVAYDGDYKGRMVIPFFDNNNKIFYYQCRSLWNQEPKYLNRTKDKDKAIYNKFHIDKSKPVVVLEGVIDSTFVENSLALIGVSISEYIENFLNEIPDVYYLLDNDEAGKNRSKKLLKQRKNVFLWEKFKYKNCKDINEVIIKHNLDYITFDSIKDCFTSDPYDMLYLEV